MPKYHLLNSIMEKKSMKMPKINPINILRILSMSLIFLFLPTSIKAGISLIHQLFNLLNPLSQCLCLEKKAQENLKIVRIKKISKIKAWPVDAPNLIAEKTIAFVTRMEYLAMINASVSDAKIHRILLTSGMM